MRRPLLDVQNLGRSFDVRVGGLFGEKAQLRAVDDVSFTIAPGEALGLVGESGCGKSTTAKLVLGLVPATTGRVVFEGQPVMALRDKAWRAQRRRMQMVYQDPLGALDRRQPVGVQVREPLDIAGIGEHGERDARMLALLDAVGLSAAVAARYPHELSGGQRQRVVLARALILQPSLLVCDEPVSSLDVSIQAQVINLLLDVQRDLGLAMLFISHDLKVVRQVADRVAVMYLGRIVETGLPFDLFRTPLHPYTQALVSAVPNPRARGRPRVLLTGDPPSPLAVPTGCAFHPRCLLAVEKCRVERPALMPHDEVRMVACHRAGERLAIAS
jgi:peptide/nickel transport system ATP-binding protein